MLDLKMLIEKIAMLVKDFFSVFVIIFDFVLRSAFISIKLQKIGCFFTHDKKSKANAKKQ